MSSGPAADNRFLTVPMGRLFLTNTLPMTLVMSMSGLLNVVDASFLGHFVGAGALAAVSLGFPVVMVTIALTTLVSGGMSSLLARHLGAGDKDAAANIFARAHGLSLFISLGLIVFFLIAGRWGLAHLLGAQGDIAVMAHVYLSILIFGMPVQVLLGVHADALRNEGRAGFMALLSVGVTLANVTLDYVLIVMFDFGVAGSAWGTVLAQGLGLILLIGMRLRDRSLLPLSVLTRHRWHGDWKTVLSLGAPLSLSFIGLALVSATVIAVLNLTAAAGSADTVAAYGIVTRIMGFVFLPQMAIALATQSIVGNNVGAGHYARSDAALRLALGVAFAYCLVVELALLAAGTRIGFGFVADRAVAAQVADILRPMILFYLFAGPVLVLALYFQAVGQPGRTAVLTLVKPFLLSPALILVWTTLSGPASIWFAFPVADAIVLVFAATLVARTVTKGPRSPGFGLTMTTRQA
ncbi:MATE family efflux transporter [Thalassovita sp.]|uniref:MATE family efflux transporter n=1 Tax=Thalassovita sp. TaxID=1979401 RepID=UPI002B2704A7|nr:MATE family efflux transporter [Thalassovita sp.]